MTFDLDTTTLDIDISTLDGLTQELQNQASLLVTVATGGLRIQAAEAEHQRRRQRLIPALEHHNLKYPFPWHDLWLWHGYWSENLPNYASRRTYIHQLVSPVLDALEQQQSNLAVANPQSQESIAVAMPEQRATRAAEQQEVVSSAGSNKCAGTTKSGNPCQAKPGASGYCPTHDPALIEKKRLELEAQEAARQQRELLAKPLQDIITQIDTVCRVRGWSTRVRRFDDETAKHAEVEVSKSVVLPTISMVIIEIDLDEHSHPSLTFQRDYFYSDEGVDRLKPQILQGLNIPIESPMSLPPTPRDHQAQALHRLEHLLERFHRTIEHYGKPNRFNESFHIELEADLQYMLYGMLINNFDDVRPEDFVPYRAGARSRIDFLLEEEKIAIETKVTRPGMNDREVGEQLIIDFERYQSAPDCQIVVCYVYDPGRFIQNPRALKKDLEKTKREIKVKVIIYRP